VKVRIYNVLTGVTREAEGDVVALGKDERIVGHHLDLSQNFAIPMGGQVGKNWIKESADQAVVGPPTETAVGDYRDTVRKDLDDLSENAYTDI
jgi:hypothetical protein